MTSERETIDCVSRQALCQGNEIQNNNNNNNNNNKVQRIKLKQLDHWQYQDLDTVLELLTGTKKNCKN